MRHQLNGSPEMAQLFDDVNHLYSRKRGFPNVAVCAEPCPELFELSELKKKKNWNRRVFDRDGLNSNRGCLGSPADSVFTS